MDNSDSDSEVYTPPELLETAQTTTLNLLPDKSRKFYELAYKAFMDWRSRKQANKFLFSESCLLPLKS